MKITRTRSWISRNLPAKTLAEGQPSNGWSSSTDGEERVSLTVIAPVTGHEDKAHDLICASLTGAEFDKLVAFVANARKRHLEHLASLAAVTGGKS